MDYLGPSISPGKVTRQRRRHIAVGSLNSKTTKQTNKQACFQLLIKARGADGKSQGQPLFTSPSAEVEAGRGLQGAACPVCLLQIMTWVCLSSD